MNHFSENNKIDLMLGDSSGSTTLRYHYPLVDMKDYDEVNFIISTPWLSATASAAGQGLVAAAVYTGTAATSTTLTAVSSATASYGSTSSAALQIANAARLYVKFNATIATGTTFSIGGVNIAVQSSHVATGTTPKCKGAGATAATSLVSIINSTGNTFYTKYRAYIDAPVGATDLSSLVVCIVPLDEATFAPTATGTAGASVAEGVLLAGEFVASISVPAEKMKGARYITIAAKSSHAKVPINVACIRSRASYTPVNQGTLAANIKLGSTTT